jgi:hypothetical protein
MCLIFPFALAGRLQIELLEQSGNSTLKKLKNRLFWKRSKNSYPSKRIWRWKFHFADDYNCWVTATNTNGTFAVNYEGTKNDLVLQLIQEMKKLKGNELFWAARKLEQQKKGILAIIYKRDEDER